MVDNQRLHLEAEERMGEIDLLRSRLALRDEALRTLGMEGDAIGGVTGSASSRVDSLGGRGVSLRAAAVAMEGLRGLGMALQHQSSVRRHSLPQHPHNHYMNSASPQPPPGLQPPGHLTASLLHAHRSPSLTGADSLPPHLRRVTEVLSQSRLPPPRPFNVERHLGHRSAKQPSNASDNIPQDHGLEGDGVIDGGSSGLSHLGTAAAVMAAEAMKDEDAGTNRASSTEEHSDASVATSLVGGTAGSPTPAAFEVSSSAISPDSPPTLPPPNSSGHQYRKLKPGRTNKNNQRHFAQHNYTDYSYEITPPEDELLVGGIYGELSGGGGGVSGKSRGSKGQAPSFPFKLHYLLDDVARLGQDNVITWLPHGRCCELRPKRNVSMGNIARAIPTP